MTPWFELVSDRPSHQYQDADPITVPVPCLVVDLFHAAKESNLKATVIVHSFNNNYAVGEADEIAIDVAIRDIQGAVTQRLQDKVQSYAIERSPVYESNETFVVLVAYTTGVERSKRKELRESVINRIAGSPSAAVRERLILNLR